jgi:hypothetical protein
MATTHPASEAITHAGTRNRLTILLSDILTPQDEETLLTQGIHDVVRFLVESAQGDRGGCTVIDLRTAETLSRSSFPACFAYIEAVRGLLQAHTLEQGPAAPAANLVVSSNNQDEPRERTIQYLQSPGGGFSRGATYDLRESVA